MLFLLYLLKKNSVRVGNIIQLKFNIILILALFYAWKSRIEWKVFFGNHLKFSTDVFEWVV